MQFRLLPLAALLAAGLSGQTLVVPAAAANADGNSSTGYPFDIANGRYLHIYDSAHFTNNGVAFPVLISQLAVRANGTTATWTGSTFQLQLDVSTSPLDFLSISTTWDNNHGADRAVVYNGSFTIAPGSSTTGTPGPFHAVVQFNPPFFYDPSAGDLTLDFRIVGNTVANTPSCDAVTTAGVALSRRVFSTTNPPAATATATSGELANVLEFTYAPAPGYASSAAFGTGCYDKESTVYETFTGATVDLAGSPTNSLRYVPNASGGFTVVPGSNTFLTPTSPDFLLTDDSVTPAIALPFAFPFGPHTTSSVKMCSNGYLWLRDTETVADTTPTPAELVAQGPRIAPLWVDLNPASTDPVTTLRIGSIHFDLDPVSNNPVFTWLNVPEFGSANTANQNTFQLELDASGAFEIRWQNLAATATRTILSGASFGLGVRDGGAFDLTGALPIVTEGDVNALRLATSARPTLGTTFDLVTSEIPSNVVLGAVLIGFTQFNPGIDLTSLGAPGCQQYTSIDALATYLSTGTSFALPQSFPNNPVFAGVNLYAQSAVLSDGANALGLISSNGLRLTLDVN
jgi:hypothetical protein